jgi:N-acetylated-alpha-linked acidic dipeptidase
MGDPGGGSDFAGFYNHLGIPILDWGFGGPSGIYHSQYDDYNWMTKFGDTGYQYHATAARIGTAMMLRLANADILPYDYVEYARTMRRYVAPVDRLVAQHHWTAPTTALSASIDRLEQSGVAFDAARDSALSGTVPAGTFGQTNQALLQVERALTRPEGLKNRPWFRNLIYVADEDNGYANMVFPTVNEAIRANNETLTRREIADLATHFDRAAAALDAATRTLGRR